MWDFPLFPEQASTVASRVDNLYFFLVAITAIFSLLIAVATAYFAIKYRRGTKADRSRPLSESRMLEAIWIGVPFVICMIIFFWGASLFFENQRPPSGTEDVYATGKQWMWKFQHEGGQHEINELHVPVGRAIKVTMTSEDVIHSLFVPAFRVKQDVLPGRPTQLWFQATKAGSYHLFCAEYCGTQHSGMIGRVVAMDPVDYEKWLKSGGSGEGGVAAGGGEGESMAATGEKVFQQQGCASCHMAGDASRAPLLNGLFGRQVSLKSGESVKADEPYIYESIIRSNMKIVAGYEPLMPIYQGRMTNEEILQLVAYIKSLGAADSTGQGAHSQGTTVPGQASPEQARGTTQRESPIVGAGANESARGK